MPGTLQVISYTLSHLISPLQEPYEVSTIFFPILQMSKLRIKVVN